MEKKKTAPMPTHTDVTAVGLALSHVGRLSVLESSFKWTAHDASMSIERDEVLHTVNLVIISKEGKTVVMLPDWDKGLHSSGSYADKIFTFLLCKVAEAALDSGFNHKIVFRLDELVESGIFKTTRSARQAFKRAMLYIERIQLSSSRRIVKSNIGDKSSILFYNSDIKNGMCYVSINDDFDWKAISKPFINISRDLFALRPQAFRVAKAVYKYIRTDCKEGTFTMPLAHIIAKSGLIVDTKNGDRTKATLEDAIKEINECPNIGFRLKLSPRDGKNISESLYHGVMVVTMQRRLVNDMQRVTSKRVAAREVSEREKIDKVPS